MVLYPTNLYEVIEYYPNGRLKSRRVWDRDNGERAITYAYDSMGRMTAKIYPDETYYVPNRIEYTYDSFGSLLKITDKRKEGSVGGTNTITYTRDILDRVTTITLWDGKTLNYEYDDSGRRESVEVKDSTSTRMLYTRYEYDKLGRLTDVYENNTGTSETQIAEYDYSKDGSNNPTMTVTYNQVTGGSRAYVSDALGRIKSITNSAGGDYVSYFDYADDGSTDGLGRRTHAREYLDTPGSETEYYDVYYTYDELGRLVDYDLKNTSQSLIHDDNYTYDAVGNRLTADAGSCTYQNAQETYGVSGAINSDILASDPNYYYYYDKNGALIKRTLKTDATTWTEYHYDWEQRLTQVKKYVSSSLSQTITYTYDPMGNLIKKTDGATTTTYVQDLNGGLPQILIEDDGATVAKYTYGADRLKVSRSGEYYYFYDGLGSTRTITNTSGTVICRYVYDVYGKVLDSETNEQQTWNNFKFTGELYDEDTDLIYLRARWYDPSTGRFLTRDAYRGSHNAYSYCNGDPVNYHDPTGYIGEIPALGTLTVPGDYLLQFQTKKIKEQAKLDYPYVYGLHKITESNPPGLDVLIDDAIKLLENISATTDKFITKGECTEIAAKLTKLNGETRILYDPAPKEDCGGYTWVYLQFGPEDRLRLPYIAISGPNWKNTFLNERSSQIIYMAQLLCHESLHVKDTEDYLKSETAMGKNVSEQWEDINSDDFRWKTEKKAYQRSFEMYGCIWEDVIENPGKEPYDKDRQRLWMTMDSYCVGLREGIARHAKKYGKNLAEPGVDLDYRGHEFIQKNP